MCAAIVVGAGGAAIVDQPGSDGLTPLHVACYQGSLACVKLLVNSGARTDRKGPDGRTALALAEKHGHQALVRYLRLHRRKGASCTPIASSESVTSHEAQVAAADEAAAALLADEEVEQVRRDPKNGVRQKGKRAVAMTSMATEAASMAKATEAAPAAASTVGGVKDGSVNHCGKGADDCSVFAAGSDATGDAAAIADEALRLAVQSADYDTLARALEVNCALASEAVLAGARASRDRLNRRRKKESQRLRRAHAEVMKGVQLADGQQVTGGSGSGGSGIGGGGGGGDDGGDGGDSGGDGAWTACPLTLAEILSATSNFAETRRIGSGGFSRVYAGDALESSAMPAHFRGQPVAVKRAKPGVHDLHDLSREVGVLRSCSHPHLLPLLGYYLDAAVPCLVFPLMRGASLADRLWPVRHRPPHRAFIPPASLWDRPHPSDRCMPLVCAFLLWSCRVRRSPNISPASASRSRSPRCSGGSGSVSSNRPRTLCCICTRPCRAARRASCTVI